MSHMLGYLIVMLSNAFIAAAAPKDDLEARLAALRK